MSVFISLIPIQFIVADQTSGQNSPSQSFPHQSPSAALVDKKTPQCCSSSDCIMRLSLLLFLPAQQVWVSEQGRRFPCRESVGSELSCPRLHGFIAAASVLLEHPRPSRVTPRRCHFLQLSLWIQVVVAVGQGCLSQYSDSLAYTGGREAILGNCLTLLSVKLSEASLDGDL